MPELPEVETIRLQLNILLSGKTIRNIEIISQNSFIGDSGFFIGKKIISLRRIAKMLVIDFKDTDSSMVVHLKMTGQLLFRGKKEKHTRVILHFADGDTLYFNDQRRFGWMRVMDKNVLNRYIQSVGPDALNELTIDHFVQIAKSSKRPIKLLLMDQMKIAGIGNIYANEALFYSGINPSMQAFRLSNEQLKKLLTSIHFVLSNGLKWGGASRTHFRDAYGKKGLVQEHFSVYDRDGIACPNTCGFTVERIILGGRGTFFCPNCQL